jgi:uncharacterized membrane protein YkoI
MEVNMTRRKMLLVTAGATVLGLATLLGFAGQNVIFADDDDDEGREALIKLLGISKINLQQGLAAGEQQGQPISAKFEVDQGKLQLSVYTAKDGKFFEVLVNHVTGRVLRTEPITEGDDLSAAKEQSAAMANAKTSLQAAVDKTMAESANTRAVRVVPGMKDGHPIASIDVLTYNQVRTIQQPLD